METGKIDIEKMCYTGVPQHLIATPPRPKTQDVCSETVLTHAPVLVILALHSPVLLPPISLFRDIPVLQTLMHMSTFALKSRLLAFKLFGAGTTFSMPSMLFDAGA